MALRAGDFVEVRSKEEILRTLDEHGRMEGLPFMPQMFQYCGQRFEVFKRAHKTCDTVTHTGGRRLPDAVHLNLRCDGGAYDGCQAACLIFWKEAWLNPVVPTASGTDDHALRSSGGPRCAEEDVWNATRARSPSGDGHIRYVCQATELPGFTTFLPWWDVRQYAEDFTSGNATPGRLFRGFVYLAFYHLAQTWRNRLGAPSRWAYDRFQALWGGIPYPRRRGTIPSGDLTPTSTLDLQPGELVRVKSYHEILATVDTANKNRGLYFDAEQVPFCGQVYRVQARLDKFIDEATGKMRTLKTPAVILEGVWCNSRYSNRRMFCPRSIFAWWRETWLERVPASDQNRAAAP